MTMPTPVEQPECIVERHPWRDRVSDFAMLTKAGLVGLVLVTTLAGFWLAGPRTVGAGVLLATLVGTGLTALGANAFNQWIEARRDALMDRTRARPLPGRRMRRSRALLLSAALLLSGPLLLLVTVNGLTAALGAAAAVIYTGIYTPLKTRTSLCTLVGAVCGAMPPVMGWTAATGGLAAPAIILAAILLVWQIPHFLSLAWVYREDYRAAGFRLLPVVDQAGDVTSLMAVLYSMTLVPIGLSAAMAGLGGWCYAVASTGLGMGLVLLATRFYRDRSTANARRLFVATLVYLPLVLAFMIADRQHIWMAGS
jgi:heme o synthase